jgi:glycosyltransferase involved in cell wall biosynthesis
MPEGPPGICLFHPQGHLARPANPFGKDIANAALFRGLVRYGDFSDVAVLNQAGLSADQLAAEMAGVGSARFAAAPIANTALPARHGVLLRGQPYLSELAWLRRAAGLDQAYSLVGLIHTIAPPAIRQLIGDSALAPTHPWDALICTSPAVQQAMEAMFASWAEHLAARVGAVRAPRPQLPLIPLAVDTDLLARQAADQQARAALRQRLAIADGDILVLWVGRLSYYEKAFPQSMFQAVQLAAHRCSRRLHFAMVGWFPGGDADLQRYKQASEQLAPDLNVIVLDGNDPQLLAQSWAAADVFLSLVDNIQETFGLAPVEAMAAGLPVVVSDWDGYRYTVRDGVDGLLVPTLGSPGGAPGELLAQLHSLELETYQTYVGAAAQHTAVHIQQAAAAIACLADDPAQRRAMGCAGQERAQAMFSWPAVVRLYRELFADLAERRAAADPILATAGARLQPLRGEPFADFHGFATTVLEPELRLRLAQGASSADLQQRLAVELNRVYPGLRGSVAEAAALLEQLEAAGPTGLLVATLLADVPAERRPYLETTLVWLAKLGLVDWLAR